MSSIKNVLKLKSADTKYNLSMSVFKGSSYISIFEAEKGSSPIPVSIWIGSALKTFIVRNLKKCLKAPSPQIKNTAIMSRWNDVSGTMDKVCVVNINTDEQGSAYLGLNIIISSNKNTNEVMLNKDMVFPIMIPNGVDIVEISDNKAAQNKFAIECMLDIFETKLSTLEASTLNSGSQTPDSQSATSVSSDDIPF